jgi:hypothetical protein
MTLLSAAKNYNKKLARMKKEKPETKHQGREGQTPKQPMPFLGDTEKPPSSCASGFLAAQQYAVMADSEALPALEVLLSPLSSEKHIS